MPRKNRKLIPGSLEHKQHLLYLCWFTMIKNCYEPNSKSYPRFGGRGIKVCDRWMVFQNFKDDMGFRPVDMERLDRRDKNGDYCPENCRWSTNAAQGLNRRTTRKYLYDGKMLTVKQISEISGIPLGTIINRQLRGWPTERLFEQPKKLAASKSNEEYTLNGETLTLKAWALRYGLGYILVRNRMVYSGWTLESALTTPYRKQALSDKYRTFEHKGQILSLKAIAKMEGLAYGYLQYRVFIAGWSLERALTEPKSFGNRPGFNETEKYYEKHQTRISQYVPPKEPE